MCFLLLQGIYLQCIQAITDMDNSDVKALRYLYNTIIYTFSWTMPPLEFLSHSQVHVCIITFLSLGGL